MTGTLNIPLLDRLRAANGEFVAWTILITEFPDALADIAALADFGFELEPHPVHGVAYRGPSPRLCPDQIEHNLSSQVIGRQVAVWNRVTSTNDLAMRAASSRSNHGLAILAEEQTAGRGSRGRIWTAPPRSSILLSVLLFPPPELDDPVLLNALAAYSLAGVVWGWLGDRLGLATPVNERPWVTIKWPNDVRIKGRKVAGILVERGKGAVIGIGLNVNTDAADFPPELRLLATSLAVELGRPLDRSSLASDLLGNLDTLYHCVLHSGLGGLNSCYNWHSEHLGHEVDVQTDQGVISGRLGVFDLVAGLKVGPSFLEARSIPINKVVAITNRSGSTYWTSDEKASWSDRLNPTNQAAQFAISQPNPTC